MTTHVELQPGDDISLHSDDDELQSDEEYEDLDFAQEASISDEDDRDSFTPQDSECEAEATENGNGAAEAEDGNDAFGAKKIVYGNFGWADAMSKVLNVKPKANKSIILAKAKKDIDVIQTNEKKEGPLSFEIEGEIKETQQSQQVAVKRINTHTEIMLRRQKRKEWDLIGRVLPDIVADRERERVLLKIGTRGVVQLFNSVKAQQKNIQERLREAGPLERKREKALKSISKDDFMNLLTKQGNSKDKIKKETEIKEEPATWNVLRDDFMPEVKMRDWDKQESSDSDQDT